MRKWWLWLIGFIVLAVPQMKAQMTAVSAIVQDSNGQHYVNCTWSVVFVGQNTVPGAGPYQPAALLVGQQGGCDSSGRLTVSLADNIATVRPTPSQWNFSICSAPGYQPGGTYCRSNMLVTITGQTQDLTSFFKPLMPLLPSGGGGGGGGGYITDATPLGGLMKTGTTLGLQTTCTSGQYLSWNGSSWACTGSGVGGGTSVTVNGIAAVPNQLNFTNTLLPPSGSTLVNFLLNGTTVGAYVTTTGGGGGTPFTVNGVIPSGTVNFNASTPGPPPNGINVNWTLAGTGLTAAVVGDGNPNSCLLGTGLFAACPGGGATLPTIPQYNLYASNGTGGTQDSTIKAGAPGFLQAEVVTATGDITSAPAPFQIFPNASVEYFPTGYAWSGGTAGAANGFAGYFSHSSGTTASQNGGIGLGGGNSSTAANQIYLDCETTGCDFKVPLTVNGGAVGGTPPANQTTGLFTNALSATLTSTTTALVWACYDNNTPVNAIYPSNVTVNPSTFVVTFNFSVPQTGTCVVNSSGGGGGGGGGTITGATANGGLVQTSTTLGLMTSCTANQYLSWSGSAWACTTGGGVLPTIPVNHIFASTGAGAAQDSNVLAAPNVGGTGLGVVKSGASLVSGLVGGTSPFTGSNGSQEWYGGSGVIAGVTVPYGAVLIMGNSSFTAGGATQNGGVVLGGNSAATTSSKEVYVDCEHTGCDFKAPITVNGAAVGGGGGSGTVASGTGGHFAWYSAAGTTVSSNTQLDDSVTTAATITSQETVAAPGISVTGTGGIAMTGAGGTLPTPASGQGGIGIGPGNVPQFYSNGGAWDNVGNNSVQSCGATSTCSHTVLTKPQIVFGSAPLVTGSPSTLTITGFSPPFTSISSFVCTATDTTTQPNTVKVVNVSASSITITGPNSSTDVINYICVGN